MSRLHGRQDGGRESGRGFKQGYPTAPGQGDRWGRRGLAAGEGGGGAAGLRETLSPQAATSLPWGSVSVRAVTTQFSEPPGAPASHYCTWF